MKIYEFMNIWIYEYDAFRPIMIKKKIEFLLRLIQLNNKKMNCILCGVWFSNSFLLKLK
jgi:hypothetical protein